MIRRYNSFKRMIIELAEGEQFCKKCLGRGEINRRKPDKKIKKLVCNKCLGEGKIDWIEKVVGKTSKT